MGGGGGGGVPQADVRPATDVYGSTEKTYMQGPMAPDGTYDPDRIGFGSQIPPHYPGMLPVGTTPMAPYTPNWGNYSPMPGGGGSSGMWGQTYGGGYNNEYPMGYLGPNENPWGGGGGGGYGGGGAHGGWGGGYGGSGDPYGSPFMGFPDSMYGGPPQLPPFGGQPGGPQQGYMPYSPYGGGGNYQNTSYGTQNNPYGFFNGFDFNNLFSQMSQYGQVDPYTQPAPEQEIPPEDEGPAEPTMQTRMQPVYSYNEFGRREMIGMKEIEYMPGGMGDPQFDGDLAGMMGALSGQIQGGDMSWLSQGGNRQDPRFADRMHSGDIWHRQAMRQGTGQYR